MFFEIGYRMRIEVRLMDRKSLLVGLVLGLVIGASISIVSGVSLGLWVTTRYVYKPGLPPECIGQATCQQLVLEAYDWKDLHYLKATFGNVGVGSLNISDIRLGGVTQQWSGDCKDILLEPTQKCSVTITVTCGLCSSLAITPNEAYPLRIETELATIFSYSVIAGGSS
jgi:hypothetical protein